MGVRKESVGRFIIVSDPHETFHSYDAWVRWVKTSQLSPAEYVYLGRWHKRIGNNPVTFAAVVEDLASQVRGLSINKTPVTLLCFGAGALVGYAALQYCAPRACVLVGPQLPCAYVSERFDTSATRFRSLRLRIAKQLGLQASPRKSHRFPEYAYISPHVVRAYANRLIKAPATLACELDQGISLPEFKTPHTHMMVISAADYSAPGVHAMEFADDIGAEYVKVCEYGPPLLWSRVQQRECAKRVRKFFTYALQRPSYLRLVA